MNPTSVTFRPIGILRSPHTHPEATPIQPVYAADCQGRAEIFPEYADGLADIEGFSHVYLLYWLHRAEPPRLRVTPYLQDVEHGVFATRAPCRPNPIGLSLVRLVRREGNILYFAGVDVLDGTPLLDLKPYSPRYDSVENPRGGWTEEVDDETARRRGRRDYRAKAAGGSAPRGPTLP
jgi:tRNA-Thr(GGU) m(6)t(6)A37 methyltransferase TsaA